MNKNQHPTSNTQHPTPNEAMSEVWEFREGEAGNRRFDLEERLLGFASAVIDLSEKLPNTRAGNHVAGQVLRSGTSPYPNHGEAEELIRIFYPSIQTARRNALAEKRQLTEPNRYSSSNAG
jgi:hypothetical protein